MFYNQKVKKLRKISFQIQKKKNPLQTKIILFRFSKMIYIIDQKHDKIRQNPLGYRLALFKDK